MKSKKLNYNLIIIIFINALIFIINNIIFDIKYEQVDDFIIYNLYSGLDGTYNIHGVYIHPLLCFVISCFYRIVPIINWHSILLLSLQFICFTIIGYKILEKHKNSVSIILYTVFSSIMYTALLMLIQYTSVAALLILTFLFWLIDNAEKHEKNKTKELIGIYALYTIGIMLRIQSLLIILPFFALYALIIIIKWLRKTVEKDKVIKIIKHYLMCILITILVYASNYIIYNFNSTYKEYVEYNNIRTTLHDLIHVDYEDNKEIFDEIGWSKNDYYMFYTFGFGDENIYSKENLQKVLDYKIQKDGKSYLNTNINELILKIKNEIIDVSNICFMFLIVILIISLFNRKNENIIIFITTILVNVLFIAIGREMLRVVIPEYIIGMALMIYNLKLKESAIKDSTRNCFALFGIILTVCIFTGNKYDFGYKYEDYKHYQNVIEYTNSNKNNVYLYTVPSLQFRYLAYPVYIMPPKGTFSNLRVIGGWDMFTKNYYDFKKRYNLEGTFTDLLKENVYLIDGDVVWSGKRYDNYKENIIYAIKENYNIDVKYTEIEEFDNIKIYKLEKN